MRFQPAVAPARHPILRSQSLAKGFPDLSKHSIAEPDRFTEINICAVSISIFSSVSRTSNGIISHSSSGTVIEYDRLSTPPSPPLVRGGWGGFGNIRTLIKFGARMLILREELVQLK